MDIEENRKLIAGLGVCANNLVSLQNLTTFTENERVELSHITRRISAAIEGVQYNISELTMILQDNTPAREQ